MNIYIRLDRNFTIQYNALQEKYGHDFALLNGFATEQLSYTDFIENFIDTDTVADASTDGNANRSHKDIVTLLNEMPKPHRKILAYNKIFYELNKQFDLKTANQWLEEEWTKALYMHDADTSTFKPYCYAYDLKRLAEKGLFFIENFNNQPPKHLGTFVDFVKEFINYTSNRTSGACGLPNLIPYMYYFWKKDVANNYYTETPEKYAKQHIQRFIYAINQPCVRDGMESAFTNTSIFDREYLEALFGGAEFPDGSFMIDELEGIMQFQIWFMETMSEIRSQCMFTFPVNTISLLKKNGKFADEEFARWASKHNMRWADSNLFVDDSVTSLSNCCRLKSNIDNLGYFNSIGGSSLRVGSTKVSTVNLARIALETNSEDEYLERLKELLIVDMKALHVVRSIIERNIEKGLLPNYADGLIDIKTQYNTIGIIGIYEALKSFGYTKVDKLGNTFYKPEAYEFGEKIFNLIHAVKDEFAVDKDYMINVEAIPGESAAAKMLAADKILFPDSVIDDLPLYGNQFIPLGIKTTLSERVKIASTFDNYCNGGSILHVNIDAPFTNEQQAWDMLNYITDKGITYFAFTTKIHVCSDNHAFFGSVCPICGKGIHTTFSRIVGFYVPVTAYSQYRKEEWELRKWENVQDVNFDLQNAV